MKQLTFALIASILMAACADNSNPTDELSLLKLEKDSLKAVKATIAKRMAEIEGQISKLDTTKSLALVTTESATIGSFEHYFQVYGSLATDQNARILPEVSGEILDIKVKEGQQVSKGQALMTLDVQMLRKQESELKTRLELAETTYKKQKNLWDKKIGSEMQYLQTKNNYEALKDNLAALQTQIAKGTITAPFSGVVDEIFPKVGEVAAPGMPLLRLINLNNMYIEADISENYLNKINAGDFVQLDFPAIEMSKKAQIERLGQYINPDNRTFKIRINVANEDGYLKPNMVTLINVNDFKQDSAVVIPSRLVMDGAQNKKYVFVTKSSSGNTAVAVKQPVEVTMSYKGKTLISSGLKGNEQIVSKGARSIRNGETVEIKN